MMREVSENAVETAVVKFARSEGWFARGIRYRGRVGCPDYLFIRNGQVVFVEFKAPGKKPDAMQTREHRRFRAHGQEVHVVDNIALGVALLTDLGT